MTDERASARLTLLWIALAAVLLRLAPAALIHLTEDEAYYRLWAQHLQLGYYDHPPMTAWWIWLGERFAGDTPLGVRLMSTLGVGAATWLLGDLALRLGETRATAVRAAVWYNATLIVALGGFLATPDAPTSVFWIATLWLIARATAGRAAWWLAAGVAAGLALLSKYSSLFLAPGLLLWMVFDPTARKWLRRWEPWAAAVIAAAIFAPNIWWNAQNHWITFAKQFGRAEASGLHLNFVPELLLTQFGLLNPLVALFCAWGLAQLFAAVRRGAPPPRWLVAASSLPFLAYLLLHSLHARVQGHWPAPVYGALALCAAAAAEQARRPLTRAARRLTPYVGFGIAAIALGHMAFPKVGAAGLHDPALALVGWPQFAEHVEQARVTNGADWVGMLDYGAAAQLKAESHSRAPLLQVNERARYDWEWSQPPLGPRGLVLDIDRRMDLQDLRRCFAVVRPAGVLTRGFKTGPAVRYSAVVVEQPLRDTWRDGCHMKGEILPGF